MRKNKIEIYNYSIKEILKLLGINGKLKFIDFGRQTTENDEDEIYFEIFEGEA